MNTEQLKKDFDRDGCLVIPGFFDADELVRLEHEALETVKDGEARIRCVVPISFAAQAAYSSATK